ncbi:type II toxin-antitoxin system Y4mF family antitoxin [Pseudarthrobacter sp. efr-133-R2A-89]|uniref:type II toxin-antitoxin system Y4mF family antitoxin n=1 Tax=Pseudarthrobacter sp. efr-133-R2A-89 TaxID=3040302 RepID=UPI002553A126|nr:type II toxin-antitoxin system Y4mF family antitoxin [Pseudarthrobacter sp. efr-133-R2A-89]
MTDSLMGQVALEVRARRKALRLNQRDLADIAGVSERFVRFVEQGKPSVQVDSLLALLDALGLQLEVVPRASHAARTLARSAAGDGGTGE